MAENLTPKKYIDSNNMKQILTAIKSKTPVGGEYVTEEQLLAKDYATKTYVGEQIVNAEHLKREIVTVLPSDTEASDNIIYMLKVESATGNDKYQEYMKIDGTVQMIGDTSVDLTDYAKTSDIPTTVAELSDSANYAKKTEIPTTLPANGGNADTVNNHTVKSDVPENAKFTDTIYDDTEIKGSITKLNRNLTENNVTLAVAGDTYITSYSAWNVGKEVFFNFDLKVNNILNPNAWYDIGNLSISPNQNFYYTCIYNYNQIGMLQITKDGLLKLYIGNVIYESNTAIIASGVYHI